MRPSLCVRLALLCAVICAPLAGWATGIALDVATVVNARCETPAWLTAGQPLEVIRHSATMTCAGPGTCKTTHGAAKDASDLTVQVEGCAEPLKGRFTRTRRMCNGMPVFRFSGRLPKGHAVSVQGARQGARIRVAGNSRLRCARAQPDEHRRQRSRVVRVTVPRSAFSMEGRMARLDPKAFGSRLGDEPLYGQWAVDAVLKPGKAARVRVEMLVTTIQHRMPPEMGCWIREETSITAVIKGTDALLSGVNSRSRSTPIDPPPKACPRLPRKW